MSTADAERSRWYDGHVYAAVIDRMLSGVHGYVVDHLPEGDRVLDACCGTGALSRRLAAAGRSVVGVDLSAKHIDYARGVETPGIAAPTFEVADVAHLELPPQDRYDVAVIVLALHEMPRSARGPVLARLVEVARRVVVVDFAVPMPRSLAGARNLAAEIAAGREHFAGFRDWQRQGGIDPLIAEAGLAVESDRRIDGGTLRVLTVASPGQR